MNSQRTDLLRYTCKHRFCIYVYIQFSTCKHRKRSPTGTHFHTCKHRICTPKGSTKSRLTKGTPRALFEKIAPRSSQGERLRISFSGLLTLTRSETRAENKAPPRSELAEEQNRHNGGAGQSLGAPQRANKSTTTHTNGRGSLMEQGRGNDSEVRPSRRAQGLRGSLSPKMKNGAHRLRAGQLPSSREAPHERGDLREEQTGGGNELNFDRCITNGYI